MITVTENVYNIKTDGKTVQVVDGTATEVIDAREVVSMSGAGGDMSKAIYDGNGDNIVDISENTLKFNNKNIDEFIQKDDVIDCGSF